ncbi:MAG: hydrogenase maturation nickel metallochaperone HypA [Candidatus Aureabacteria bacterium]|nr:hydrogenase maturation nickel metallochaperone HypA [Candidatus Auribacterota bacterium]
MHELRYASSIIAVLEREVAAAERLTPIVVNIRLSLFSHVTPERLNATLQVMLEDKDFADVRLHIIPSPFTVRCKRCGHHYEETAYTAECRSCKNTDLDIDKGLEFCIDSFEIQ